MLDVGLTEAEPDRLSPVHLNGEPVRETPIWHVHLPKVPVNGNPSSCAAHRKNRKQSSGDNMRYGMN